MTEEIPTKKRRNRFTPEQIAAALKDYYENDALTVDAVAKKHGMTKPTLYYHRYKSERLEEIHYLENQIHQLKEQLKHYEALKIQVASMQRRLDEFAAIFSVRR
jgi:transposase-like protein